MATAEVAADGKSVEKSDENNPSQSRDLSDLVIDGKNSKTLTCERCGSKVLLPGFAVYVNKEVSLMWLPVEVAWLQNLEPCTGHTL